MANILIKGGTIFDGYKFFSADIKTSGSIVEKIAPNIDDTDADFIFDASEKIVSAGLVDAHVHMSGGEYGINPEMCTLPFGVVAAADAGVGEIALTDNLGVKNVVFVSVKIKNNLADFEKAEKTLLDYGEKAVGMKIYFDRYISELKDITPLIQTLEFAEKHGLKVMVHCSNSPIPMQELLDALRPGDILTHAYHGGINNVSDDEYQCIKKAKERGVIIDAGFAGHIHTDFDIFRRAVECEAAPDIISSDITKYSAYKRGGKYGLPMCMSIAKHLGMEEADIFKAVTSRAARALGKEDEFGVLKEGGTADIAVLEYSDEGFELTDKAGNYISSKNGYRNILTIVNGDIVYRR